MKTSKKKFPMKLDLRSGLHWQGTMTVEGPVGQVALGATTYLVHFDAEIVDPTVLERFVFDRTVLTAGQIWEWTGVDLESWEGK